MNQPKLKLSEMGTTGLVSYVVSGAWTLRGCRRKQAERVIQQRHGAEGVRRFQLALTAAWKREALS